MDIKMASYVTDLKKSIAKEIESQREKVEMLKKEIAVNQALIDLVGIAETARYELPNYLISYHKDNLLEDGRSIMALKMEDVVEYSSLGRMWVVKNAIDSFKNRTDVKTYPSWGKRAMQCAKLIDECNQLISNSI